MQVSYYYFSPIAYVSTIFTWYNSRILLVLLFSLHLHFRCTVHSLNCTLCAADKLHWLDIHWSDLPPLHWLATHCTVLPPTALACHPLHSLAPHCTSLPPIALACHPLNWLATHCSAYLLNCPLILVISFSICYLPTPSNNPTPHSKALTWRLGPLIQQPLLHICSSSSKSIPRTISSIKSSSLGPADFLRVGLLRV